MSNESMISVFRLQFSYFSSPPPPPAPPPPPITFNSSESKISQSVLLIIIILAVIFFISGILHLLVRFFLRPRIRDPDESDSVTALQGQLQQLFNLHDAGVDQSFIDTLPVFLYKTLMGAKNPFDCAVCLCEFEQEDKLRLLPKCSHAFHMECIDTWLLSHSTCPLCRSSLLPDFSPNSCCSPIVFVLESNDEDSREISPSISVSRRSQHLRTVAEDEFVSSRSEIPQKLGGLLKDEQVSMDRMEKILHVKLGNFRNVDCRIDSVNIEASSSRNVDDRRCFSMGSFEYVLDESSILKVAIKTPAKKETDRRIPGYRSAMSECDFHSRREEFKGFEFERITEIQEDGSSISTSKATVGSSKTDSFSISKIWLRHKRETSVCDSSRRASSFRLPISRVSAEESRTKGNNSNQGSDGSIDEEIGSVNSLDSTINSTPSFARKTLLWLMGRQNKMVHSSSANPV